jgi:hypothetical protein
VGVAVVEVVVEVVVEGVVERGGLRFIPSSQDGFISCEEGPCAGGYLVKVWWQPGSPVYGHPAPLYLGARSLALQIYLRGNLKKPKVARLRR